MPSSSGRMFCSVMATSSGLCPLYCESVTHVKQTQYRLRLQQWIGTGQLIDPVRRSRAEFDESVTITQDEVVPIEAR